tara:strand:+ start:1226 stop:2140 length:915 start_codon:yes stop_codon:yes gene_type:complete
MDPIEGMDFTKDSTIAIAKSLQGKANIKIIEPDSLTYDSRDIFGNTRNLKVISLKKNKYVLGKNKKIDLKNLDCIFFRKDPPVNDKYISILQVFRELEYQNTLVINSPESLLRHNEKILGCQLSEKKIPTIITCSAKKISSFSRTHGDLVLKPMNMMAGQGVIKLETSNDNKKLITEYINKYKVVMAQKYLDEVKDGDNRIIIYNGIIENNVLTRLPPKGDFIANLANGGNFKIKKIERRYLSTLKEIASYLSYHGIFFAGVDMIGDYITEINITSPTGIQQIGNGLSNRIANELLKKIKDYYA